MPELRHLRAFVAVAEDLSFTRAAERLHLGQQAVSKTVAQLERELGVALLERTTHDVRLTAAGEALLGAGRDAVAAADAAFALAQEAGSGLTGRVRAGVTPAVGPADREQLARVLREGAPDLSVSIREVRPGEIGALLRGRDLDFVLARSAPADDALDSAPLRPTPVVLCVPAGHRLAGAARRQGIPGPGAAVRLAELDGERLLTWSPAGTPYTDLLVNRLAAGGARVEPVEAHVTGDPMLSELAGLDAVALVPAGWPPSSGIAQLTIEDDVTLPLLVLWPIGRASAAVRRTREGMSGQRSLSSA
jgi:DNA-binding transcriptional LysR family regulator